MLAAAEQSLQDFDYDTITVNKPNRFIVIRKDSNDNRTNEREDPARLLRAISLIISRARRCIRFQLPGVYCRYLSFIFL